MATGTTTVHLSWAAATTGPPAVRYDIQVCNVKAGIPAGCGQRNIWVNVGSVAGGTPTVSTTRSCQQAASWNGAISTCYFRVRGVAATGVAGPFKIAFLTPWAPFTLILLPAKTVGQVQLAFRGPSESGPPPKSAKYYIGWACRTTCASASSWSQTTLRAPYPPNGLAGHILGTYDCGVGNTCWFRMQFVDSAGLSIATPPVVTSSATTSGSTPPTTTTAPPGTVTATGHGSTPPSSAAPNGTGSGGSLPFTGSNTTELALALLSIAAGIGVLASNDRRRRYRWRRRIGHALGFR
jgi:hypothetical protein